MSVGWLTRNALAATVALGLVQVPALAQKAAAEPAEQAAAPAPQTNAPAGATPAAEAASPQAPAAEAPAAAGPPSLPYANGSIQDGAAKAAACAACHGPNGNSANPEWPRLAGQSAVYIAAQLHMFRAGTRTNPVMKPMASTLSDKDINDLAVYFEAQTVSGLEADPSFWAAGNALYRGGDKTRNIPACVACHGPVGRGNLAGGYPALRAQQSVYVVKQLNDYASGARYTAANVPQLDPNSAMMFTIAKRLTPEDIRNVASYVQGMR